MVLSLHLLPITPQKCKAPPQPTFGPPPEHPTLPGFPSFLSSSCHQHPSPFLQANRSSVYDALLVVYCLLPITHIALKTLAHRLPPDDLLSFYLPFLSSVAITLLVSERPALGFPARHVRNFNRQYLEESGRVSVHTCIFLNY